MAAIPEVPKSDRPFADQLGDELAPAGTFAATVIDIKDEFGVTRQKFESTELETVDLTTFLFGFRDEQNVAHKIASRQMKISGHEKSALFGFLKSLTGKAPKIGWDYCELRGHKCLLTIEHQPRRNGTGVWAGIAALSPLPAGYGNTPPAPQPKPAPAPVPPPAEDNNDEVPF